VFSIFVFGACYSSVLLTTVHMGLFALDRYFQIVHPFFYRNFATKRRAIVTLTSVWISGIIYTIIPLILYSYDEFIGKCTILNPPLVYYSLGVGVYLVVLIIVFLCYFKIALVAFNHKKAANARRLQTSEAAVGIPLRNNRLVALRSVKFFVLMFGVYFVCSFPPVVSTGISEVYNMPPVGQTMFIFLMPLHSIVNFFIYVTFSNDFSRVLRLKISALRQKCFTKGNEM
jgi:hypothetical protein